MFKNREDFELSIKNKKVAILGIGISNKPLTKLLYKYTNNITVFDKRTDEELIETINLFKDMDISYSLGQDYLKNLKGFEYIFRSPGIRFDIHELIEEKNNGAIVTSEMETFMEICPAKIIAVTGSDGKTTTTTIIHDILKKHGYRCWLGGNLGIPLLDKIDEIKEDDMVILELSSFQLQTIKKSPSISVITNISPNHLDIHKSYDEYVDSKKNIFIHQNTGGKVVLNYDNDMTNNLSKEIKTNFVFFSRLNKLKTGFFVDNGKIVYSEGSLVSEILNVNDIRIPGKHNVENYLAAIAAIYPFVNTESIKYVAKTFNGVEHRIELVRELNGIKFFNSSIDSSPNRTIAALTTFQNRVILLAGGKDKNIPYEQLGHYLVECVKSLILIGPTGPIIEKALINELNRLNRENTIPVYYCDTYAEMVKKAYNIAKPGDIVLLSPASTSFDMFANFEERGKLFKKLVNELE